MAGPTASSKKFQSPKGTRDFYPQDMAVRRYIEGVWRQTSINHGFDEVDGPTFEDIELYKHKSGPGIVSEIFQVYSGKDEQEIAAIRAGKDAPYALRPEFTPTLARMVAAKAAELPRPIKWFAIPTHFRAERPQRGRLREFMQWNVDFIFDFPGPHKYTRKNRHGFRKRLPTTDAKFDVELMTVAIDALSAFGLTRNDVSLCYTDRRAIQYIQSRIEIPHEKQISFTELLDRRAKLTHTEAWHALGALGLEINTFDRFDEVAADLKREIDRDFEEYVQLAESGNFEIEDVASTEESFGSVDEGLKNLEDVHYWLRSNGVDDWCEVDHSVVRGLAYYTGTVFEIHETSGAERAIAGGGRYDNLIASFGGPSLPACGFGMGDVVLANLLHDKGLLPEEVYMKPLRPHAFAIAASDEADAKMRQTVAQLRRDGFHVRHSYKTTRNVGKLLSEASKSRAMSAIIFGKEIAENRVDFKDLQSGEQTSIPLDQIESRLKQLTAISQ